MAQRTLKALASGRALEEDLKVPLDKVIDTLRKNDARPRKEARSYLKSPPRRPQSPPPAPRKNAHERLAEPPRATGAPQRVPRRKIDFSPEKAKGRGPSPTRGKGAMLQEQSALNPEEDTMVIDARPDSTTMRWVPKKPTSTVDARGANSSKAPLIQADLTRSTSLAKGPTLPEYAALMLKVPAPQKPESKPSSVQANSEAGDDEAGNDDDQLLDYEGEDEVMEDESTVYECNTIFLEHPSLECCMAFLLSSDYALPEPVPTSQFMTEEGHGQPVCTIQLPEEEEVADDLLDLSQSNHKYPDGVGNFLRQCMAFARPTFSMAQHIRPLYVSAEVEGIKVRKILIDTGAAVSVITTSAIEHLKVPKERILSSAAKVKGFSGNVTPITGVVMLKVKIGPSDAIQGLFVTETSAPYSMILGRDWIHKTWSVPSSLHQELVMWDQATDRPILVKGDEHPYSIAACHLDASSYNRDLRPLQVKAVDQQGRPIGVTSSDLKQWGITRAISDDTRPITIALPPTSPNE